MDQHGGRIIAGLRIDSYNLALRQNGGFVGDRIRSRTLQHILDDLRQERRAQTGSDPLDGVSSADRAALDILLGQAGPAADVISAALDVYARSFADVVARFLACPEWQGTEQIVIGGGLLGNRIGEEAVRRASACLETAGISVILRPIRSHPDEAALLGGVRLCAAGLPVDRDSILAVDIGGGNVRAGVVLLNRGHSLDLSACEVMMREHWRYRDEGPDRDAVVDRLAVMLNRLAAQATASGLHLAPVLAVGCPGEIRADGAIVCGGQNLPGDWEATGFNLPTRLQAAVPTIGAESTVVLMHNDAVLQGLSEQSSMRGTRRWGVLTIGTGLGNARFSWSDDSPPPA